MREIKFRGKSVDPSIGDRWLTGFGVAVAELSEEYSKKVGYSKEVYLYTEGRTFQVSEESVGQYTGLKDKNGVEIYEGDVVRGRQTLTTVPTTPSEVVAVVEYSERNTNFCLSGGSGSHDQFTSCLSLGGSIYQYEVIGNIFENPELLKESVSNE